MSKGRLTRKRKNRPHKYTFFIPSFFFSSFRCQTNCGHLFCTDCILSYARSQGSHYIYCPLCRQQINLLMECFSPEERDQREEYIQRLYRFNSNQNPTLIQSILDIPRLAYYGICLILQSRLSLFFKFRLLMILASGVLYLLSPLDLVPESVLGPWGTVDDIFVLVVCGLYLSAVYRQHVLQGQRRG
eukprot:TRINITY_DN8750_c0_g1_i5.p1 TRINITY_DN8750_c0_g1~~TRINITY_DN8750_c0_g1_i5.p1  ORF type:complete len:187 (-),score=15.44 TRINITY_DN8750_c0_g1_i5:463-1023(-)